jgi:hypothetical protein
MGDHVLRNKVVLIVTVLGLASQVFATPSRADAPAARPPHLTRSEVLFGIDKNGFFENQEQLARLKARNPESYERAIKRLDQTKQDIQDAISQMGLSDSKTCFSNVRCSQQIAHALERRSEERIKSQQHGRGVAGTGQRREEPVISGKGIPATIDFR